MMVFLQDINCMVIGELRYPDWPLIGVFCSSKCPSRQIIKAFDYANYLADRDVTVASGFQSSIEKELLRIIERGTCQISQFQAKKINENRIPRHSKQAMDAGRLVIVSSKQNQPVRITAQSAFFRNKMIAQISDELVIIHAEPGGSIEKLVRQAQEWDKNITFL